MVELVYSREDSQMDYENKSGERRQHGHSRQHSRSCHCMRSLSSETFGRRFQVPVQSIEGLCHGIKEACKGSNRNTEHEGMAKPSVQGSTRIPGERRRRQTNGGGLRQKIYVYVTGVTWLCAPRNKRVKSTSHRLVFMFHLP